jgi:hypothetical protein
LAGVQHLFEIWVFDRFLLQRCCVFANQAAHLDVDIGGRGCTFAEIGILFGLWRCLTAFNNHHAFIGYCFLRSPRMSFYFNCLFG